VTLPRCSCIEQQDLAVAQPRPEVGLACSPSLGYPFCVWIRTDPSAILISGGTAVSMTRAYEEIIDFIAAGPTSRQVAEFEPPDAVRIRVADLLAREKTTGLSPEETSELTSYLQLEHLMRLAKARARRYITAE
jgi:hypothetical protein